MPRKRLKQNQALPSRWRHTHGAYYYQVPLGQEALWDNKKTFRLGSTLPEAYKEWAARLTTHTKAKTINDLLDRYALEVIPTKAAASQQSNLNQLPMLRKEFGQHTLLPFPPKLVYQYVDKRSVKQTDETTGRTTGGRIAAHREVELLSHAYTKAVEWGYIDKHPFKSEVRLKGEKPRDRYIEDWEVTEMLSLASNRSSGSVSLIQAYIRLKLLTGMAQGDILRLTEDNLKEDGIHVLRHKTKAKRTIYQWTPELRQAIDMLKKFRPVQSHNLLCTREGYSYIDTETGKASGWKSMWQRFVKRVLKETKVKQPFTEHDLRAKVASDAKSLDHARSLLSHADSSTTNRIYRRKAEVVKPLR